MFLFVVIFFKFCAKSTTFQVIHKVLLKRLLRITPKSLWLNAITLAPKFPKPYHHRLSLYIRLLFSKSKSKFRKLTIDTTSPTRYGFGLPRIMKNRYALSPLLENLLRIRLNSQHRFRKFRNMPVARTIHHPLLFEATDSF